MTVFILNVILLVRSELLPSKGTTLPRTWNQILVLFLFSFKYIFLSTLSVRRATLSARNKSGVSQISIHALRKESDGPYGHNGVSMAISIHALREESDRLAALPAR